MDRDKAKRRREIEQRLAFIACRPFREGHINHIDVMAQPGVPVNQASSDLNRYIALAPGNVVYDKSARTYVRGSDFKAQFLKPDASRYLAQLRSLADGLMDSDDAWIAELPAYDAAPTPARGVNPVTLRSVVGAIRRSEPQIRGHRSKVSVPLSPRAKLAVDRAPRYRLRWHTRAFCKTDEAFKDFLLSRILRTRGVEANGTTDATDADWQEHVTLEIAPTLNSRRARRK